MTENSKPLILNCYTTDAIVYNNAKINHATKFMPGWFKKTPNEVKYEDGRMVGSIKNCHGLTEMYRTAIVIPCWTEFTLDILHKDDEEVYRWTTAKRDFKVEGHPVEQYQKFAGKDGTSIKLVSPWMFQCDEKVNFVWHQPTWNTRDILDKLTILPAVMDFNTQHATEINYFIVRRDFERQVVLKALEPLVMLHAMDDRKVEIKNHLITEEEKVTRFAWHFELGGTSMEGIASRANRSNRIALQKHIEYLNSEEE
jgi:hypothetical protein